MTFDEWIVYCARNRERGRLIQRQIAGTITNLELVRLNELNKYVDDYIQRHAPRPTGVLEELEQIVKEST